MGEFGRGGWLLCFPRSRGLRLCVCGVARRICLAGKPAYALRSQHKTRAELWRGQAAIQLEYADSYESERKGNDLHRSPIPVSLSRSWTELGANFSRPHDQ